ncbi:hypothetical protein OsI_11699 [Oryza sativa Indica Group]|uniref:Uncharacterized protein n=1 Tax=Oryza sativa subsp. indica TaxID=39946 RepID=B8AQ66_ORYSI|nr:hypothetical protein OsI_11699 [Oryza sativa Indica Group]
MAARRLIPSMNRVLVEKLLQPNKSAGGILLPETTKQSFEDRNVFLFRITRNDGNNSPVPYKIEIKKPVSLPLQQLNSAKVVAVGPGERDRDGKLIPVSLKEGDTVLLPEYGGTEVKLAEKEYLLFREHDILGRLEE